MGKKVITYIIGGLVLFGIFGALIITNYINNKPLDNTVTISYFDASNQISWLSNDDNQTKQLNKLVDPLYKSNNIDYNYIEDVSRILEMPSSCYNKILKGKSDKDLVSIDEFELIYDNYVSLNCNPLFVKKDILILDYNEVTEDDDLTISLFDGYNNYELIDGIEYKDYIDKVIECYIYDDKIIKIIKESDNEYILTNAYIKSLDSESISFAYNNLNKTYLIDSEVIDITSVKQGVISDLNITNNGINKVSTEGEIIEGKVGMVDETSVRIVETKTFYFGENFKIYNVVDSDNVICDGVFKSLMGYEKLSFRVVDDKIAGIIIDDKVKSENIRVLLNDSSYSSYKIDDVVISSESEFAITINQEDKTIYEPDEEVRLNPDDYNLKDIIKVETTSGNGTIALNGIERNSGVPEYRGIIELTSYSGYFNIVNEVNLEEYLYGVVSSEIPSSYPSETQKAMAICARGYAYAKLDNSALSSYGAHLDDSTLCQVYNNISETDQSISAVKDTYGMVATYNDEVITPFYYSTSFGVSSNNAEIWTGEPYEYLLSRAQTVNKEEIDLSKEEDFKKFVSNSNGLDIIEQNLSLYRWNIHFTDAQMTEAVNMKIAERSSLSSDTIKITDENDRYVDNDDITSIGDITNVEIAERYPSGVVKTIIITSTDYTLEVSGQSNIRSLITPVNVEIIKQDGTPTVNWTSLPSPFYYVEKSNDGYDLVGGGFGHGVGLSQNGAMELANMGYDYKFIIKHYYTGAELSYIY